MKLTVRPPTPDLGPALEDVGVDPTSIPKVVDHRKRMSERATVGKAIAQELGA
jgi:hypothetical protein